MYLYRALDSAGTRHGRCLGSVHLEGKGAGEPGRVPDPTAGGGG